MRTTMSFGKAWFSFFFQVCLVLFCIFHYFIKKRKIVSGTLSVLQYIILLSYAHYRNTKLSISNCTILVYSNDNYRQNFFSFYSPSHFLFLSHTLIVTTSFLYYSSSSTRIRLYRREKMLKFFPSIDVKKYCLLL